MKNLYLTSRLFLAVAALVVLFVLGYYFPTVIPIARLLLWSFGLVIGLDVVLLFITGKGISAGRSLPARLSNGDANPIGVRLENNYGFPTRMSVIDEIPFQFQLRNQAFYLQIPAGQYRELEYTLRPTERGNYRFGALNVYVATLLGLVQRRFRFDQAAEVPTYPSFLQMKKYALYAISNRLSEVGVKKVRRVGHTLEFDQIRAYVRGDDYRTVNWKATARNRRLMVNQYQDERAQQVYCLIDIGRAMKMPFDGMSLLDYAINASLVLSNIALQKHDKAGLVTFAEQIFTMLPAGRKKDQMNRILESLYQLKTGFKESSYARLHAHVQKRITHRSLLILFTNFESRVSMLRQLPYLRSLARRHLLVVVFFENTALNARLLEKPESVEAIYLKTIAEQFAYEKREIVQELKRYGIQALLTPPEQLTINTINQYLELKARRLI